MRKRALFMGTAILSMVVFLTGAGGSPCYAMKQLDKEPIQKETYDLLEKLDLLYNQNTKKMNALFADQSEKNICRYAARYCQVQNLIEALELNMRDLNALIKQNKNDKVYRAFIGTVQFGLYSIYSRPNEFIGFIKLYKCNYGCNLHGSDKCKMLADCDNVEAYDNASSEWAIKADMYLHRAKASVRKALLIDPYYSDAKVLNAQILVAEEQYGEALQTLEKLETEMFFIDKESYLDSWRAYINFKMGDLHQGEFNLKQAYARSQPMQNASWASSYLRTRQKVYKKHDLLFLDHVEVVSPKDKSVNQLMKETIRKLHSLRGAYLTPFNDLPGYTPDNRLIKSLLSNRGSSVFLAPDSYLSSIDKGKMMTYIEDVYEKAMQLQDIAQEWDVLIRDYDSRDKNISNYYRMFKSKASLVLLEAIRGTQSIVLHEKFDKLQKDRQSSKENQIEPVDYTKVWKNWDQELTGSLEADIKTMTSGNMVMMGADLIAFEYNILSGNAAPSADKIEEIFNKYRKDHLKINNGKMVSKLDKEDLIQAWNAYQVLVEGDIQKTMENLNGLSLKRWGTNMKKTIHMEKYQGEHKKR